MPRPNYGYEKYQRELAKQKKREAKRQRKLAKKNASQPPCPHGGLGDAKQPGGDANQPAKGDVNQPPAAGAGKV